MNVRAVVTTLSFVGSLVAIAIGAGWLSFAVEAFSPLEENLSGTYVPAFTKAIIDSAPAFPTYMGLLALLTTAGALYLWRSSRPADTKSYWVSVLATLNVFIAGQFPLSFLIGYFVLPRAVALAA
jgi:hypothetical protein